MQKQKVPFPTVTLVGLTARTNNQNEINPATSKIGELAGAYWDNQMANNMRNYPFAGWVLQKEISEKLSLGGEVYTQSAATNDSKSYK